MAEEWIPPSALAKTKARIMEAYNKHKKGLVLGPDTELEEQWKAFVKRMPGIIEYAYELRKAIDEKFLLGKEVADYSRANQVFKDKNLKEDDKSNANWMSLRLWKRDVPQSELDAIIKKGHDIKFNGARPEFAGVIGDSSKDFGCIEAYYEEYAFGQNPKIDFYIKELFKPLLRNVHKK